MAIVSQTNGGSAPQQAPATPGTSPGIAATFLNLISLLLGSDAAPPQAQDPTLDTQDASAKNDDKSQRDSSQSNSIPGSASILMALSPLANAAPVVIAAGAPVSSEKTGEADAPAKDKKRRTAERNAPGDMIPMTAAQSPTAVIVPAIAAHPGAASASPVSAPTQSNGAMATKNAALPAEPGFISDASRAPKKSEPPVAFVLELKPNGDPNARQVTSAEKTAAHATQAAPLNAADLNTGGKLVRPDFGEQNAGSDTHQDSAPAIGKPESGPGNRREDMNEHGRPGQHPDLDQQQRDTTPVATNEGGRVDSILRTPAVMPAGPNNQPHAQPATLADTQVSTEAAPGPATVNAPPDQPKPMQVREISLQSSSSDAGAVRIQVVDRGGDVRISVRSSDPNLTHALQRDVGQLVTKLDHAGYETKAWSPRDSAPLAGIAELRDAQIRPDSGSNGNSGSDSSSRGGQGGAHDQSQQQRRHGDARQWISTLDDSVNKTISEDEEDVWQA